MAVPGVPGVSQCTHIDFFCDGSKALDGQVKVFLRAKAVYVYVKIQMDGHHGRKESQRLLTSCGMMVVSMLLWIFLRSMASSLRS